MLFVIDEPPPALPLSQFPAIAFSPLVSDAATSRSAPGLPASLKGKGSSASEEMPNFDPAQCEGAESSDGAVDCSEEAGRDAEVHGQEDEVNSTSNEGKTSMMRTLGIGIAIALSISPWSHGSPVAEAAQKSKNAPQGDRATTMTAIALAESKKKQKAKGGRSKGTDLGAWSKATGLDVNLKKQTPGDLRKK